jgi:ABC-2 type transport system permease protein
VAVGVAYALLAALLLKVFEIESRRRASLDTI